MPYRISYIDTSIDEQFGKTPVQKSSRPSRQRWLERASYSKTRPATWS